MKRFLFVMMALVGAAPMAQAQVFRVSVPEVRVNLAPPPPRVEVQMARPSPNHTWIAGHWAWSNNAHVWLSGHWMLAPNQGMVWEAARWTQQGGGWVFVEGHWRWPSAPQPTYYEPPAPPTVVVESAMEPPAPIVEVQPAMPFGGAIWMPGYWHWNGAHHVWVGGHYSAGRPGYRWEPHRWERGPGGRWAMRPGHWQR